MRACSRLFDFEESLDSESQATSAAQGHAQKENNAWQLD
jgi:hypothetical protein